MSMKGSAEVINFNWFLCNLHLTSVWFHRPSSVIIIQSLGIVDSLLKLLKHFFIGHQKCYSLLQAGTESKSVAS